MNKLAFAFDVGLVFLAIIVAHLFWFGPLYAAIQILEEDVAYMKCDKGLWIGSNYLAAPNRSPLHIFFCWHRDNWEDFGSLYE